MSDRQRQHTPETWHVAAVLREQLDGAPRYVNGPDGHRIATVSGPFFSNPQNKPNARRIVACVNACVGLSNEALEAGAVRDLLDALEWVTGASEMPSADGAVYAVSPDAMAFARHVLERIRPEQGTIAKGGGE